MTRNEAGWADLESNFSWDNTGEKGEGGGVSMLEEVSVSC